MKGLDLNEYLYWYLTNQETKITPFQQNIIMVKKKKGRVKSK